jgi:hypothetical protein
VGRYCPGFLCDGLLDLLAASLLRGKDRGSKSSDDKQKTSNHHHFLHDSCPPKLSLAAAWPADFN